jgi:hypothetical protein
VLQPGICIGREIGIFGKDFLRAYIFLQLNQVTMLAYICMEWIERLHLVQLLRAEEAFT